MGDWGMFGQLKTIRYKKPAKPPTSQSAAGSSMAAAPVPVDEDCGSILTLLSIF